MPALPPEDNLDGDAGGFNQGIFKQALRDLRGYLAGLLGTTGVSDAALAALKLMDPQACYNLKPTFAVDAGALTCTFKDKDGNDLGAANLGIVSQRASALGDGGFNLRKIAANVALAVNSGATLGHFDGVPAPLFWYLIEKDANTELVAVCGQYLGRSGLYTTVAIGAGADSASVLYASEAVADKPGRLVAISGDTQAAAGTWATLPSAVQPAPFIAHLDKASASTPIVNGKIVLTHNSPAANKLTIALKTERGNDPSLHDPVIIAFRSATLTSSEWVFRAVIGPLSTVISDGSSGGHASGINQHLFVYPIDTAAGVELAWSNLPPDYPGIFGPARLVSTTAEGGAGAADSAAGIYSTTARANVPWACIAKAVVNNAAAGNWAAAPVSVDMAPFTLPTCGFIATAAGVQTIAHNTSTIIVFDTETLDLDACFDPATYRHQPNLAGLYEYAVKSEYSELITGVFQTAMSFNAAIAAVGSALTEAGTNDNAGQMVVLRALLNGTTSYANCTTYQSHGSNRNLTSGRVFSGSRISGGRS